VKADDADARRTDDADGRLHLLLCQSASKGELRGQIEQLLVELAPHDLLLVVGPAPLLTDHGGRHDRARLLSPSPGHTAPLRYVTRLPKGLGRFGGRRRLALWVLGRPGSDWTVVGTHADVRLDAAAGSAIAADVAAAVGDPVDVRAHAFRSSSLRSTPRFVRQQQLIAVAAPQVPIVPGGERLARIWGLHDALVDAPTTPDPLTGVDLEADNTDHPITVTLSEASPRLAADRPGKKIPAHLLGPFAAGSVGVLGPEEVRDPTTVGRRGVDRLNLEREAPRARLTDPGDVVYVAAGGPAAFVDNDGGHVVLAPARVLRCRTDGVNVRLVPSVVAADIAAQPGTDRNTWRLRTVPVEQIPGLDALTASAAERRSNLLQQLRTLDDLERELVAGVTDGTLRTPLLPPAPTTKAAR
jgi:hypothetical protein